MSFRSAWRKATRIPRRAWRYLANARNRRTVLLWSATVPAIAVLASVLWMIPVLTGSSTREQNWYAQKAAAALARGDAATARLCYASLLQRRPDNLEYQYGLAMCLMKLGDQQSAGALIHNLAPEAGGGLPAAHIYIAEQLLADPAAPAERIASAQKHLSDALKADPKNQRAHALMAGTYTRQERWDLASEHLKGAGPSAAEMGLVAAQAYAKAGDMAQAQEWTQRAEQFYAAKVRKDPSDDDSRVRLAQAKLMQRQFSETIEILEEGWKATKKPIYPRAIANVTGLWISHTDMNAPRKLALLETGLRWNAQDPVLLKMIVDTETLRDAASLEPATQPVAGAMVRALCASVIAARNQDADRTRSELQGALELGGEACTPIATNALCTWAYSDTPDLPSALLLATTLRGLRPDDMPALRAQGLIFARQAKWQECLASLEPVIAKMPEDTKTHEALANAYENVGKPDLAAKHRVLAHPATAPATAPTTNLAPRQ